MMRLLRTLTILGCLLAAGCAQDQIAINYQCDPAGAMLYAGDRALGQCPKTLYYAITPEARQSGKAVLQGVGVRYPSGAQVKPQGPQVIDLKNGLNYRVTVVRAKGPPGYEADVLYGLEHERNRVLSEQAGAYGRAASASEAIYWNRVFDDAFSPLGAGYRPGAVGSCTSQDLGGIITTNCY